jgi:hypothetical protein
MAYISVSSSGALRAAAGALLVIAGLFLVVGSATPATQMYVPVTEALHQ